MPRMSIFRRSPERSARRSIAIRPRRWSGITASSPRRFPQARLIAFSVKANGNLAVLKTLARLGAGADVVSGGELKKALRGGHPARTHRLLRRRQDESRDAARPRCRHPSVQCRERTGTRSAERGRVRVEQARADHHPRQSGCRCQDPRQDHDRHGGDEIRHSVEPRARRLCTRGAA